jgi:hypothetical protein
MAETIHHGLICAFARYPEHWNVAGNHGRAAAQNIAREHNQEGLVAFTKPAIFWSAQGEQLRYVGTGKASQWQDVIIDGSPDELNVVAYYFKDDCVVAVATMKRDPLMVQAAELFARKKFPSVSEVRLFCLEIHAPSSKNCVISLRRVQPILISFFFFWLLPGRFVRAWT